MGDATNLVLIFAGELLKRSEHLLTMGLHPSDVIQGYEMALDRGRQELESVYLLLIASSCYSSLPNAQASFAPPSPHPLSHQHPPSPMPYPLH